MMRRRSVNCPEDTSRSTPPKGWQSPETLEQNYHVTPLIKVGDLGQGQTLGLVTLASTVPSDPPVYWSAYGIPANPHRIRLVNVDGGTGPVSNNAGSGGTAIPSSNSPILPLLGITVSHQRAWAWAYIFPYWQQFGASSEASFAEGSTIGSNGGYSVIVPEPA